jgi:hypothetical protein
MAADAVANGGVSGPRNAWLKGGAWFTSVRNYHIAGLKLAGSRGFAKTKAYGGGATANRNNDFAQIHLEPKRFM